MSVYGSSIYASKSIQVLLTYLSRFIRAFNASSPRNSLSNFIAVLIKMTYREYKLNWFLSDVCPNYSRKKKLVLRRNKLLISSGSFFCHLVYGVVFFKINNCLRI